MSVSAMQGGHKYNTQRRLRLYYHTSHVQHAGPHMYYRHQTQSPQFHILLFQSHIDQLPAIDCIETARPPSKLLDLPESVIDTIGAAAAADGRIRSPTRTESRL